MIRNKRTSLPAFKNENEEADWWASQEGRNFVKQESGKPVARKYLPKGSTLVAALNKPPSVQIALRVPETDLAEARRIASRKGIGYQTLLKMLLHEGLQREGRRRE